MPADLRHRRLDWGEKLTQVYDVYSRLETMFPEQDVLSLFEDPKALFQEIPHKAPQRQHDSAIDSLDLLFFWMVQPRARTALAQQLAQISRDEQQFVLRSQQVLRRKRVISEMLHLSAPQGPRA